VEHCADAHALLLSHAAGWRLAFSGDCRPSAAFADAARGCTLLVHEATFEATLAQHAEAKRHCTTEEALQVAQRAAAAHTVLTHFSQRGLRAVPLPQEARRTSSVAHDGMRLSLGDPPDGDWLATRVEAVLEAAEQGEEDEEA
jgi:ribonuclease Z